MQLASHGLRALKGTQAHLFPPGGGQSSRSIHIPALHPRPATTTAQNALHHARAFVSSFFAHLTTPGTLRGPISAGAGQRAFVHSARMPTIQQRMSAPVRHILSKPLATPFLPRAPAVPRHISQVGLGTARNFSTGRPVFQHLIENVPIYARAFSEADWHIRIEEERERMRVEKRKAKAASKAMKKATGPLRLVNVNVAPAPVAVGVETEQALEHYFPAAPVAEVVTYLLIPLAPTPTSRMPLSPNPPSSSMAHPLLPLSAIAALHSDHGTHALRVSTIFARLDTARVFEDPNVHCEARGDPSGLCTVLEVRFEGWTANKVRGVLGEAGSGWCVLEEVWPAHEDAAQSEDDMDAALDALSEVESEHEMPLHLSNLSGLNASWSTSGAAEPAMDPAQSFVLPTLDFSASFPASSTWSRPGSVMSEGLSDLEFHNEWSSRVHSPTRSSMGSSREAESDLESDDSDWFDLRNSRVAAPADRWLGFSSHFSERMGPEMPREELF